MASGTYNAVSPYDNDVIATAVSKLTIATGPVAKYLDEPKKAATATGKKDAQSPQTGSKFANDAYAIDWGIIIIAIVVPAIISLKRYSFFEKASGNHDKKFVKSDWI